MNGLALVTGFVVAMAVAAGLFFAYRLTRAASSGSTAKVRQDVFPRPPKLRGEELVAAADKLWAINDHAGAISILREALAARPDDIQATIALAQYEVKHGDLSEAEMRVRAALGAMGPATDKTTPRRANRLINVLVTSLLRQGRLEDAWDIVTGDAGRHLDASRAAYFKAHICRHTRRYEEAEALYRQAIVGSPRNISAMAELADLLGIFRRFNEAEALHKQIVEVEGPAANAGAYSYLLLAQGRVRDGWGQFRFRSEHRELESLPGIRVWDGSDLTGRSILVIREGGTGDEIRDAVCYREISQRAARTTITCEPRLESLHRRSFPKAEFRPLRRGYHISHELQGLSRLMHHATLELARQHDWCALSPDLFYYLKPAPEDYGEPYKYLVPDPARVARWKDRLNELGPEPKIGISWSTIRIVHRMGGYYTSLTDWQSIFGRAGLTFVNLQYGDCENELREAEARFGIRIHRWSDLDLRDDFESVAALITSLDLVLAPNNTVLELSGALGTPVWYMINEVQTLDHWRLADPAMRQDRCYRSARVFMPPRPGDAQSLLQDVGEALASTFLNRPGT